MLERVQNESGYHKLTNGCECDAALAVLACHTEQNSVKHWSTADTTRHRFTGWCEWTMQLEYNTQASCHAAWRCDAR